MWQQAGRFAAVGVEIGFAMAIGVFGGRYLDGKFDTEPLLFWIGFTVGLGAAVKALVDATKSAWANMNK
jgi:ATP synthase protein I